MIEIGDLLGKAWEDFKRNGLLLVVALLITSLIPALVQALANALGLALGRNQMLVIAIMAVMGVVLLAVSAFLEAGLLVIFIKTVRGEAWELGELFAHGDKIVPFALLSVVLSVGITLGFALLIIPGVILLLMTCLSPFFLVDRGGSFVDAIRASVAATAGHRLSILLYLLVAALMQLGGLLACGFGILITGPLALLGFARIYDLLAGNAGKRAGH
jgi:uncharacterized membrane protein